MDNLIDAIRPAIATAGSRRLLDHLYGPMALELRRVIVEKMTGEKVVKSDRRCRWGHFRKALLNAAGITGTCIADEDSQFEELVTKLFPKERGAKNV